MSWRLYQPATTTATIVTTPNNGQRQSSNYALDQIILQVVNPFSTRLASLELDNTAISGTTLTSTVLILRRETLQHVSVRGCKNVSLKYHINPWLQMHLLARESTKSKGPPGFETLALKSLYTYRCRHHRRRPYLPSSLARKESDSEPTHELVSTCHKLGIWTDTAWCTTPGARCYRRRGYVKLRMPQDPREVWVVYDRLWRSRNWLGPVDKEDAIRHSTKKRKRDCRTWEFDEEGMNGEPLGTRPGAKTTPAHLRDSHRKFVENIVCQNCSTEILERCEQCSVMMHCAGCRKTLCSSCAFDRPYLRNKNAPEEERNKFWWAPGCAVSPCSMQDQDMPPQNNPINPSATANNSLPNIRFKWCCTEPLFSGGGGITFSPAATRDTDRIRAAPLPMGEGWEDPEFDPDQRSTRRMSYSDLHDRPGPGGRWQGIDDLFRTAGRLSNGDHPAVSVPRVLCNECYAVENWKINCKTCGIAICLKHDIGDRVKARICGYKELSVEKQEFRSKQKALKLLTTLMMQRKGKQTAVEDDDAAHDSDTSVTTPRPRHPQSSPLLAPDAASVVAETPELMRIPEVRVAVRSIRPPLPAFETPERPARPLSPASNSTGPLSRSTSPTPSTHSTLATPEPGSSAPRRQPQLESPPGPKWRGCQTMYCSTTRAIPGDHRRRCTAVLKQCLECKIHVCADCTASLEPACPCKGCQTPDPEENANGAAGGAPVMMTGLVNPSVNNATGTFTVTTSGTTQPGQTRFFCPNCKWDRMVSGKCKRKSEAFLAAVEKSYHQQRQQRASVKKEKARKRKEKMRKPVEERIANGLNNGGRSRASEEMAIDGLVEFFTSLNAQYPVTATVQQQQGESSTASSSSSAQASQVLSTMGGAPANTDDIRELEDMGVLARDLIRRIQRLRDQFRPGSLAALALPDIRLDEDLANISSSTIAGGNLGVNASSPARDEARRIAQEAIAMHMAGQSVFAADLVARQALERLDEVNDFDDQVGAAEAAGGAGHAMVLPPVPQFQDLTVDDEEGEEEEEDGDVGSSTE
jgi:hypothetical protein